MTTNEFAAYKSEIQLKMNGKKNHDIINKLAGIEGYVIEELSEEPSIALLIEKAKAEIIKLLAGESIEIHNKSKEFSGYSTIGA